MMRPCLATSQVYGYIHVMLLPLLEISDDMNCCLLLGVVCELVWFLWVVKGDHIRGRMLMCGGGSCWCAVRY